jgi:hypothetical protein
MKSRIRGEEGWALVTSLILLATMLSLGLAVLASGDSQSRQAGKARVRESRLNLTEVALSSQIFALSRNWPGTAAGAYPALCTQASTDANYCPVAARVRGHFATTAEFRMASTWTVQVRDNGGTSKAFYSDGTTLAQPSWDADGDGQVWVRAEGRIGTEARTVVARVKVESLPVTFPNAPFVSGSFGTSNSGNKLLVETGGTASGVVRCTTAATINRANPCVGYEPSKGQIDAPVVQSTDLEANIITPEVLDTLRQTARANGTHYTGCPANPTGKVVFVETGNCSYNNSSTKTGVNSDAAPGIFVINNGTLSCNGNIPWYGVVYLVNEQASAGTVMETGGGCSVYGGVFIDGPGHLQIGSNGVNLVYNSKWVLNATAYGTAGIVQNTWREYYGN